MQYPSAIAANRQTPSACSTFLRPTLYADEWWWCYVVRTLSLNEYPAHREYLIKQLEPHIANAIGSEYVERFRAGDKTKGGGRRYSSFTVPQWAVDNLGSIVSVCPHCVAQAPYVRLHWTLRSTTCCELHGAPLISRCSTCSCSWRVWNIVRGTCSCGLPIAASTLSNIDPCDLSLKSSELVELVSSPVHSMAADEVEFSDTSQPRTSTSPSLDPYEVNCACRLFLDQLLRRLSQVKVRGVPGSGSPTDWRTPYRWLDMQGISVQLSLDGVSKFWPQLRSAAYLRASLEWVCFLLHQERDNPTVMSSLPLMFWAQELAGLGASIDKVVRLGWVAEGSISMGKFSLKRASKITGVSEMHIKFLMRKNLIKPAGRLNVGGPQHLFTLDQLDTVRLLKPKAFGVGSETNLGLPKHSRNVLRQTTILERRVDAHGVSRFLERSIHQLFSDLTRHSKPIGMATTPLVKLSDTRIWSHAFLPALSRAILEMRQGSHLIFSDGESPGFSRYFVTPEFIATLRMYARSTSSNADCSQVRLSFCADLPPPIACGVKRRPTPIPCRKFNSLRVSESQTELFER